MEFDCNGDLKDNEHYCEHCGKKLSIFLNSLQHKMVTVRCECSENDFESLTQFKRRYNRHYGKKHTRELFSM